MHANCGLAIALVTGLWCAAAPGAASAASSLAEPAIECVQQELNALGFDAGAPNGTFSPKTFLSAEAYLRYMKANAEPGWTMPSLSVRNAEDWCSLVAQAHPKVDNFRLALEARDDTLNAEQIFALAHKFDVGAGVPRNEELAARWYLRAARLGYAPAQRNLAGMYASGRGLEKSESQAAFWFLRAAQQGDAQAEYVVGEHYSADEEISLSWLWKAADQGHAPAIAELEKRLGI
jgi:hypothetical protein